MKGLFAWVFSRMFCPVSSSILSISDSGYQKAQVPLGLCLSVIFTSSALFTIADSCFSDRLSDSPLASTSAWTENTHTYHEVSRNQDVLSHTHTLVSMFHWHLASLSTVGYTETVSAHCKRMHEVVIDIILHWWVSGRIWKIQVGQYRNYFNSSHSILLTVEDTQHCGYKYRQTCITVTHET